MEKNKNLLKKLLSFITYKKTAKPKEFYIPEVGEANSGQSKKQDKDSKEKPTPKAAGNAEVKKPVPLSDIKKKKEHKNDNVIPDDIESNLEYMKDKFNYPENKDIIIREFKVAKKYRAFIIFIDGMVDKSTINNFILRPLLKDSYPSDNLNCQLDYILENVIETNQAENVKRPDDVIYRVLIGDTALYVDGCNYYIVSETKGFDKRGVETPQTEGIVKGSQEAFNENLRTNITLLRRIIKNNNLTTEFVKIGEQNRILFSITYIKGLANPAIVDEVKRRLNGIKTDFIMCGGMLEQFIEDHPMSLVPTLLSTERPDRTASHISEGRVAIIAEGSPFAIIVPVTFETLLHSPEDTAIRWQYGTFIRFIRIVAILAATLLPGIYIAFTNYHQEMIPTELLIAIAKARENVPFPTITEILVMEVSFELIREAGVRVPGIIGNTIGIIGALIIGQAAVQANLVSPVLIIIIAVTGLGNFAIPDFSLAFGLRIIRLLFIFAGAFLGFYGILLMIVVLLVLLSDMKSFGVPYLSTMAPKTRRSFDSIIRFPVWKQEFRPDSINPLDVRRQPKISRQWTKEEPKSGYGKGDKDE